MVKNIFQSSISVLVLLLSTISFAGNGIIYDIIGNTQQIGRKAGKKDLQGFDEAWEFVRTHPRGADAWEMIRIAIGNNNGYTQFARDLRTLQKVAGYLSEIPQPNGIRKLMP
ncbi:MAG: hypothetical protein IPK25_08285 [Saprospiraceae bacterium]|nr:hypothetical protein [Saprospiraceae bacterium]